MDSAIWRVHGNVHFIVYKGVCKVHLFGGKERMVLKKLLKVGMAGLISVALLASCGGTDTGETETEKETTAAATTEAAVDETEAEVETSAQDASGGGDLSGKLVASGSTYVQPLMEALAEEFTALNPGVTMEVQAGGSTTGFKMQILALRTAT